MAAAVVTESHLNSSSRNISNGSSRSRSDSRSQCQAYLDDYMQRATANAGATQYNQPGQYMLVPVTVEVPQMSVYRDGTPAN